MKRRTLLLAPLAACAATPPDDVAVLAPGIAFRPPPPAALGARANLAQHITATTPLASFAFDAQLALTPEALNLVALDSFGRRLLTLSWSGGAPRASAAPGLPDAVRPANLVADLVLIYWPAALLEPALAAAGATLETRGNTRSIRAHGQAVIEITYLDPPGWQGRALYRNQAFGYRLLINSVSLDQ